MIHNYGRIANATQEVAAAIYKIDSHPDFWGVHDIVIRQHEDESLFVFAFWNPKTKLQYIPEGITEETLSEICGMTVTALDELFVISLP